MLLLLFWVWVIWFVLSVYFAPSLKKEYEESRWYEKPIQGDVKPVNKEEDN